MVAQWARHAGRGGLDFAPIWIAQRKGYFKEEGIDFEHILTTGGAVTMAAVMNGDVQFVSTAASDVLVARSRGDRMFSVGIFPASLEWHIATNNKWLESRGLAKSQIAKMTVAQKIQALKGTTIGAVTVGGAPAQVVRYLLRQNNLKPDADVRFAAVGAGSPSSRIAPRPGPARASSSSSGRRISRRSSARRFIPD